MIDELRFRLEGLRPTAVIAAVAAVALVGWLVFIRGDGDDAGNDTALAATTAVKTSPAQLGRLAERLGHPVYWAGERSDTKLELTTVGKTNLTAANRIVFIRYLDADAEIGTVAPFPAVASYPVKDAISTVRDVATGPGGRAHRLPGGGIASSNSAQPTTVFLAYPGEDVEVQVYDPAAGEALRLARSGAIRPVG